MNLYSLKFNFGVLRIIALGLCVIFLVDCSNDNTEKNIRNLISNGIVWTDGKFEQNRYSIFRFVKPSSCASCELRLGDWSVLRRKIRSRYGDDVGIYFVISVESRKDVESLLKTYGFINTTEIDTADRFIEKNPMLVPLGNDVTLLVDSVGTIKIVGDPSKSRGLLGLYDKIISDTH